MSNHPIFRKKTVKLIKEYILEKFPSNPTPGKTKRIHKKRKPKPLWHEYDSLRELGFLKANENEDSSARNDPDSCAKGNCLLNFLCFNKIIIINIFIMYRNKALLREE